MKLVRLSRKIEGREIGGLKNILQNTATMKKIIILLIIGLGFILEACEESEDVTPSMADKDRLETLLDRSIPDLVSFKEKYGTYILYDFDQLKDFAYQFEAGDGWRKAKLTMLEQGEVQQAYDFLEEQFFASYQDSIIEKYFPRKFLICSKIQSTSVLGISTAVNGFHTVVTNINSFTVAGLDRATLNGLNATTHPAYIRQLHYMYLAGYLVNVRRNVFVNDKFFDPCEKLYGEKIDRTGILDEDYFMRRGFFYVDKDVHYYPQQIEDLQIFVREAILMDADRKEIINAHSVIRNKIQYVVRSLIEMGVDMVKINPLLDSYK